MTAGYDPSDPAAPDATAPQHEHAGQDAVRAPETERLGPLPPRITSPAAPVHTGQLRPGPGTPGSSTAAMPQVPPGSYPPPGLVHYGPPAVRTGHHTGALPTTALSHPYAGSHAPATGRRGGRLGTVAFVLTILLLLVAGGQSYLLLRLNQELDQANKKAAADSANAASQVDGLEARIKELEKRAGNSLDAQAVAAEVTPSVFRVIAGRFSGTAFALGKEAEGGGTNLLTNFHVVESVYNDGGRNVALERTSTRFPATIVRVDENNDLALLHSDEKFPRLAAELEGAKPGQPVIVVGAPLGLEDTVTTGVVSAVRDTPSGRLLQFDAPINPGNSGGPVINAQRKVVGVATLKARGAEGIGLAVPIGVACQTFGIC
jgi:putative serine protease PepD